MKSLPLRVLRRFKHIGLLLLLVFAGYLTAGRLLMPLVSTQSAAIESNLSVLIGAPVSIAHISGAWFRFSPSIAITDLRIGDPALPDLQHSIGRAELSLDVVATLLARRPVIDRLSVADMHFILQEQADGRWGLSGVPYRGGDYTDPFLDFLLGTNELGINEGTVLLQRASGDSVEFGSLILNVQNRLLSHDAQLQLRINDQPAPAHAVMQLRGDPRRTFAFSGWLDSENVNWLPLVQDLLPAQWNWQQLDGHIQAWVEADSNGLQNLVAAVNSVAIEAVGTDAATGVLSLQSGSTLLALRPRYGSAALPPAWNLRLQQLAFDWQNTPWDVRKLELTVEPAPQPRLRLQADSLDTVMLEQLATTIVPLPAAVLQALQTLDARGKLNNFALETAPDGSYPQGFKLRANLQDVAVNAWQQAPAASGVQGYVEADAEGGFAEVDSRDFTLHLPRLFADAWHYDRVNTRVNWRASPGNIVVQSSVIDLDNADLAGRVRFDLYNVRNGEGLWYNDFTLEIGVQRMNVAAAPLYLPTLPRIRPTMDWLRAALKGGELGESGFLLHQIGGRAAPPLNATQVLSWYRVNDGTLQFLPDWPAVTNLSASVVQRNNDVDIVAQQGELVGIALAGASASIRPDAEGRQLLALVTSAATSAASGLDFLRKTPVHNTIGDFIDNWQATGSLAINVGLGVDLRSGTQPLVQVKTMTNDALLDLRDYDLQIENIVGKVDFDTRRGLSAEALTAQLFDFPLKATITTLDPATPQQAINIAGSGKASVTALQQWSGQPLFVRQLFNYMQGEMDYDAVLKVEPLPDGEGKQTHLLIESDLLGMTVSLPRPLDKAPAQISPLVLELGFAGERRTLDFHYSDWLTGELQFDTQGIERGQVSVGKRNRTFNVRQTDNNAAGVLVTGDMESFDVMAWEDVARELNQAGGEGRAVADYLRLVDVNVGTLIAPGRTLEEVNVVVQRPGAAWQISAHNELLSGNLVIADDRNKPWDVALKYLHLPPRPPVDPSLTGPPPDEPDPLQDVNPAQLPAFDFHVDELNVGDQTLGEFTLQFRPDASGASITGFRMQSPDAQITDSTGTVGATLDWRYLDGVHQSSFTGLFAAGDLAKVLPAWGHDANVVSNSASFDSVLQWVGSPLYFSPRRSSGTINLDIEDGRFVDIDSGSTRLLGALNFDALVRRLQLDFSDIFSKGYSFDSIDGLMNFADGVVTLNTPLTIDGPSSDLSIRGQINLRDETIAADMQVQIPLGENLSMVAGLLGAWPIAVSTYLASKIFQSQVEDFTTVIYRLEGPWAQPTTGFEPPAEAAAATEAPAVTTP